MADRNLDIALRIQADMGAARQQIDAINQAVANTGKAADGSNAALGRASQRMDALVGTIQQAVRVLQNMDARLASLVQGSVQVAQATAQVEAGTAAAVAGLRDLAETEDQAAARIRAVIAASREQIAAEQAAAAAATEVTASTRQRNQAADDLAQSIQRQNAQMRQASDAAAAAAAAERQAGAAAQDHAAELARLLGQIDPTIAALERLDRQEEQLQRFRNLGVLDAEGYARFRAQIEQSRAALGRMGVSAGQTAQAMRMLPAQITDITVSLASGMPVWMVFLQQGGQIKDSFGGIKPALEGVLSVITPLRLAIGGLVGMVALLTAGAVEGYLENERMARSILTTGNYAGVTSGQVDQLAASFGSINGRTDQARQILNGLIDTGRVSAETLSEIGRAAVNMAALTGKSAQEVVAEFSRLADDPVRAAMDLDRQYHFLNTTLLQQIQTLQRAGDQYGALNLAAKAFADDTGRKMDELHERMGWLETRASQWSSGISNIKQWFLDLGKPTTEIEKFQAALANYNKVYDFYRRSLTAGSSKEYQDQLFAQSQQAYRELQAAQQAALSARADAAAKGVAQQVQTEGKEAAARIDQLISSLDRAKQRQDALNKAAEDLYKIRLAGGKLPEGIDFNGPAADVPEGPGWDKLVAEINRRYADPKIHDASPKIQDTSNAIAAATKLLQDQILSLGQTALGPVSGIWDQYSKAMLAAADAGGKAIKAGGDVATVQGMVSQVQDLAAQARDRALADQQRNLQIAYAQATGDQATAAKLQIEAQYGDLLQDLQRRGDAAGVQLVQSLINVGEARAQLQQLQQQVNTVLSDESRQEQTIQAEQQAGLISEYSARQQILDLHQRTGEQLDQLLPKYRALAQTIGDPAVTEQLKNTEAETQRLKLATNDFKQAFESGFTGGLEQALEGLATRATSVRDAFRALADSVLQSLAQIAARALAEKAIGAIGSLFGGQQPSVGQDAAKLAVAGGVVTDAAVMMGISASRLQAAASTLLAANMAKSPFLGFAVGGYTGPGGIYDIAGVVHAGEYVQPAFRMGEPGALAFMRDFHAVGMAAIDAWALRGYADGGYVAPLTDVPRLPAPRTPAPRLPDMAANGARGPTVGVRVINVTDPSQVGDYLDSSDGEAKILNIISRNESRVRQMVR